MFLLIICIHEALIDFLIIKKWFDFRKKWIFYIFFSTHFCADTQDCRKHPLLSNKKKIFIKSVFSKEFVVEKLLIFQQKMEKHKLNFEEQSRGGTEKARKAKEKKQKKQTAIQGLFSLFFIIYMSNSVRWSTPSSSAERTKSTPRGPTKMQLMERMAQLEQHNAELEERCAVLQERNAHLTECHVGVRIKKR